jgi:hypothetical protein
MKQGLLTGLLVAVTLALTGCGDSGQQDFDKIRDSALQLQSPWDAYSYLMGEKIRMWTRCDGVCSEDRYAVLKSADGVLLDLYHKALNEPDPRAYSELFVDHALALNAGYDWDEAEVLRQVYATKLITVAKNARTSPINRDLLEAAGIVEAQGEYVHRNYPGAIDFLYRAWIAGSSSAAETASKIATTNHHPLDAYLWALRCIGRCSMSTGGLDQLSKGLDASAIQEAQRAATDQSVKTLTIDNDTSKARKLAPRIESAVLTSA